MYGMFCVYVCTCVMNISLTDRRSHQLFLLYTLRSHRPQQQLDNVSESTQPESFDDMEIAEHAILRRHATHKRGGKIALSERSGYWLRAMQVDGDTSDTKLNLNLALSYMYFTGRVIPKPLMWGSGTVSAVSNRLQWYESRRRSEKIKDMVRRYPRTNIFCQTDDSRKWHGVGPSYPYIDPLTGKRSIERSITTMAHYIKKKDTHNATMDKEVLEADVFII